MKNVAIIGSSGSGKTTLGKKLAEKMRCSAVDLDELHWEPGWRAIPDDEFVRRLTRALEAPGWVASGNYSRVQEYYLEKADTLIWLDYPFVITLGRVLKRTFMRVVFRQPCCNGNHESLARTFSRDSIILWVFQTYGRRQKQCEGLFAANRHSHLHKLRFRHPREAQKWLNRLEEFRIS